MGCSAALCLVPSASEARSKRLLLSAWCPFLADPTQCPAHFTDCCFPQQSPQAVGVVGKPLLVSSVDDLSLSLKCPVKGIAVLACPEASAVSGLEDGALPLCWPSNSWICWDPMTPWEQVMVAASPKACLTTTALICEFQSLCPHLWKWITLSRIWGEALIPWQTC